MRKLILVVIVGVFFGVMFSCSETKDIYIGGGSDQTDGDDTASDGDDNSDIQITRVEQGECTAPEDLAADEAPSDIDAIYNGQYPDEISVESENGMTTIVHRYAWYNCGASLSVDIAIDGHTITLQEEDISTEQADCMCYFEIRITLHGLEENVDYTVIITDADGEEIVRSQATINGDNVSGDGDDSPTANECSTNADCEGSDKAHDMCDGFWQCMTNTCAWVCNDQPDGGLSDGDSFGDGDVGDYSCQSTEDCYNQDIPVQCPADFECINGVCEVFCQDMTGDPRCRISDDCYGRDLPHPECEGVWDCVENFCQWECI